MRKRGRARLQIRTFKFSCKLTTFKSITSAKEKHMLKLKFTLLYNCNQKDENFLSIAVRLTSAPAITTTTPAGKKVV